MTKRYTRALEIHERNPDYTMHKIGELLGIHGSTAAKWINRARAERGYETPSGKTGRKRTRLESKRFKDKIHSEWEGGCAIHQIASVNKCSVRYVRRIVSPATSSKSVLSLNERARKTKETHPDWRESSQNIFTAAVAPEVVDMIRGGASPEGAREQIMRKYGKAPTIKTIRTWCEKEQLNPAAYEEDDARPVGYDYYVHVIDSLIEKGYHHCAAIEYSMALFSGAEAGGSAHLSRSMKRASKIYTMKSKEEKDPALKYARQAERELRRAA